MPTGLPGHDHDHGFDDGEDEGHEDHARVDGRTGRASPRVRPALSGLTPRSRLLAVLIPAALAAAGFAFWSSDGSPGAGDEAGADIPVVIARPVPPVVEPASPPGTGYLVPPVVEGPVARPPDGAAAGGAFPSDQLSALPHRPPAHWGNQRYDPETGRYEYEPTSPLGKSVRDLKVVDGPVRPVDKLGEIVGLPARSVSAVEDEDGRVVELSPFIHVVGPDGKVVVATPVASAAFTVGVITLLAALVASVIVRTVHEATSNGAPWDFRGGLIRFVEFLVLLVAGFGLLALSGLEQDAKQVCSACLFAAGLASWIGLDWRGRISWSATALGVGILYLAAWIPMVPPAAALAHAYGPLGMYGWDILFSGGTALVLLAQWLPWPRHRVSYVTVSR